MSSKPDIEESGSIVDAYHGTDFNAASSILVRGFKPSEGTKHWLGEGAYFYEGSREHAYNWALNVRKINPRDIVVIHALVKLGRCLDFHRPEHADLLEKYFNEVENRIHKKTIKSRRYYDEPIRVTESVVIDLIGRDTQSIPLEPAFPCRKSLFSLILGLQKGNK